MPSSSAWRCLCRSYPFGALPKPGEAEGLNLQPINNSRIDKGIRRPVLLNVLRWTFLVLGGVMLALMYFGIHTTVEHITDAREDHLNDMVELGEIGVAFGVHFASSWALVLGAALLVIWQPVSGSSSMPEIITLLNGAKVANLLSSKVFLAKAVGLILAVSSGLVLGPEGPTIYLGAMMTVQLTLLARRVFQSTRFADTVWALTSDREMQHMVVIGAASGIATAFRSPIGGVLFVLEEAISFFDSSLIWKTYFICVIAYYILEILFDGHWLNTRQFTEYNLQTDCGTDYVAEDIFLFAILGCLCGFLGALFNFVVIAINKLRIRIVNPFGYRRLLEISAITLVTSLVLVLLPIAVPQCRGPERLLAHVPDFAQLRAAQGAQFSLEDNRFCLSDAAWRYFRHQNRSLHANGSLPHPRPPAPRQLSRNGTRVRPRFENATTMEPQNPRELQARGLAKLYREMNLRVSTCSDGEYSEMASLMHNSWHSAVGVIFSTGTYEVLSASTLAIFLVFFFILAAITAGSSVAAGLVIPMLAIGGAAGRLVGVVVNMGIKQPLLQTDVDPGPWAIVGAAAFWSGSGRITVTIAVIMLEITGDFRYLPPMAVAVVFAKVIGDLINHGLYHEIIHLKNIPFLEDIATRRLADTQLKHAMRSPVVFLHERDTVGNIQIALQTTHNGFPVVAGSTTDPDGGRRVAGLVLRGDLEALVPAGYKDGELARMIIEVSSAMNETPSMLVETTQFSEAHRLFRFMGLRHLVVVDFSHNLRGIITRRDLMRFGHGHDHSLPAPREAFYSEAPSSAPDAPALELTTPPHASATAGQSSSA